MKHKRRLLLRRRDNNRAPELLRRWQRLMFARRARRQLCPGGGHRGQSAHRHPVSQSPLACWCRSRESLGYRRRRRCAEVRAPLVEHRNLAEDVSKLSGSCALGDRMSRWTPLGRRSLRADSTRFFGRLHFFRRGRCLERDLAGRGKRVEFSPHVLELSKQPPKGRLHRLHAPPEKHIFFSEIGDLDGHCGLATNNGSPELHGVRLELFDVGLEALHKLCVPKIRVPNGFCETLLERRKSLSRCVRRCWRQRELGLFSWLEAKPAHARCLT
eukprot:Amastigsp_a508995_18.p2 type:complete len:271 gc:universal Amastigsp_a508995_18:845-33(-)